MFYILIAEVVMPDHTHLLLTPSGGYSLSQIMKGIKGVSARKVNQMRNTTGTVWQDEYYDRIIRDQKELDEKIHYFSKYVELKGILASGSKITEPGYETTTIADCDRYIEKFKRSILAMNNGLQKMRSPELTSSERDAKERTSILSRLQKINVTDPVIIGNVVEALYPIKQ